MIKPTFKKGGVNFHSYRQCHITSEMAQKFDGIENIYFDLPKSPNMLLVEKLPKLNKNNNIKNYMELDIKENNISSESDSDDDILFAYERYSLKKVRKRYYYK